MRGITVFRGVAGGFGGGAWRRPRRSAQQPCHASSAPQPGGGDKLSVWRSPLAKAAYTNASLAVAGDFIAQGFELRSRTAPSPDGWDAARTARLGGFGLFFYGPLMHFWYGALNSALPVDRAWPLAAKLPPFLAKARPFRACASAIPVALNQLVLGPVVVTAVFAWSLGWSRRLAEFPAKWRRDTLPTLRKGWAFWVPASSINFALVPIQFQVLYMSACGIVWTTILSAASATKA